MVKHFFIKKVRIRCSNFLANLFDFSSGDVRKAAIATADFVIVAISAIIAAFITQLFLEDTLSERLVAVLAVGSALGCVAAFSILKVYHIQWMDFCQRHFVSCFGGVLMGDMAAVLILGLWLAYRQIPLKPFVVCSGIHIVVSCMSVFLFRYLFRKTFHLLIQLNANMYNGKRTLIIGGGYACMVLLQEQQRQKRMHFSSNVWMECFDPICILDDDISKHGKSVAGVQIVGKTNEVRKYVHKYSIEQILFAIPSCPKKRRQKILNACNNLQIPVKLVPAFDVHSMSVLGQVRDINMEDLLGRDRKSVV